MQRRITPFIYGKTLVLYFETFSPNVFKHDLFALSFRSMNVSLTLACIIKTITQYFLPAVLREIKLALDGDFANSLGAWSSVNERVCHFVSVWLVWSYIFFLHILYYNVKINLKLKY